MPIGTTIIAARAGTVLASEDSAGTRNFVAVLHDDGTVARYVRLTDDGALVQVGDVVDQGQTIGLSGVQALPGGPHLHFDVAWTLCQPGFPCPSTIPVTFRNTAAHPVGLKRGRAYTAFPF